MSLSRLAQSNQDSQGKYRENSKVSAYLPLEGKMRAPVEIYASPRLPLSSEELDSLKGLARLPHVEKVVALPDLHVKPRLEAPSSIAAAVRDHLVLGLSSPSPNCGMALVKTGLTWEEINEKKQDLLFADLAERLPLNQSKQALSGYEMQQVLTQGPAALLERYGFTKSVLENMDQGSSPLQEGRASVREVLETVPDSLQEIGRRMFGQIGKGNHFLELQVVQDILDPHTAAAWGLEQGQVLFMYHADSGYLGAFTGRIFAHRSKNTWKGRIIEWRLKLPFHVKQGSKGRIFQRLDRYMLPRRFAFIPAVSEEGRRARLALWAAGNYAGANRLAILAELRDALSQIWGDGASPVLLWDAPHNSILPEEINGETLWVHRHNAARVVPPSGIAAGSTYALTGHPVLLPGTERTLSYLCASGENAGQALFSADHGAGRSAIKLGKPQDTGFTRVYGYQGPRPEIRKHMTDDGVWEVMNVLETAGIARQVVSLRPAAVLKAGL
jgi:tRNA-splicing ligase RtcB (3'-phosphate/5'-hydroxy nucleic acid ligase)